MMSYPDKNYNDRRNSIFLNGLEFFKKNDCNTTQTTPVKNRYPTIHEKTADELLELLNELDQSVTKQLQTNEDGNRRRSTSASSGKI